MKIKHFFSEHKINYNDRYGITTLIEECDFIFKKKLYVVIDPRDKKSLLCFFDEYDEACGFLSMEDTGSDIHICEFYVGLGFRQKGYGTALLNSAIKYSKLRGYDSVSLRVANDNDLAQEYYKKNKFIVVDGKLNSFSLGLKRYNLSSVYEIGGILYELSKNQNVDLRNALDHIECKEEFYKYFSERDEEKLDKRLNSKTIRLAIDMLEGKEVSEEEKYYKRAQLCVECFNNFKNQEIILQKKRAEQKIK